MTLFRPAGAFWDPALRMFGGVAITMPWGVVYAHDINDRQMRKHEIEHLRQIRHEGAFAFSCRYLRAYWQRGYWWNPYEVAARVRSGEASIDPGYERNAELWRLISLPRKP